VFFNFALSIQLRRDITPGAIGSLLIGTIIGIPFGVWILASAPASVINRLIGLMLVVVALLEWRGLYPRQLAGRQWSLGTGVVAGILGGSVGLPGPPVIVYAASQPWAPRTLKANLQAFFFVNQALILAGYWWSGLLTEEVATLTLTFAVPAALGVLAGMVLFSRVDPVLFRRIVFGLIFVSGLILLVRG
jgi:uncharacterized membrane protein YfcA